MPKIEFKLPAFINYFEHVSTHFHPNIGRWLNCFVTIDSLLDFLVEELGNGNFVGRSSRNVVVPVLDLLSDCALTGLLANQSLGLLQGVHQSVDSLVQLAQVCLHIFLLALRILWFFISVEGFEILFVI